VTTTPDWLVAWAGDEKSSVLEVTASGAAAAAVAARVPDLVGEGVVAAPTPQDGAFRDEEVALSSAPPAWVDLTEGSRGLVDRILALREDLRAEGVDRVVLCAPVALAAAASAIALDQGSPLVVLDSADPDRVRTVLGDSPERTAVVVSGEREDSLLVDSLRRAAEAAFAAAGVDPARRTVAVAAAGAPLEAVASRAGYREVFIADPQVTGPHGALSAFGLVPSGLAGADVVELLDDAAAVADLLLDDAEGNPGLVLGAALGGTAPLHDKVVLLDARRRPVGLLDWVERLLAGTLGGLLPVVVEADAPELRRLADDVLVVRVVDPDDHDGLGLDDDAPVEPAANVGDEVTVAGALGAQFLLWEYAVAAAGRLLGVEPGTSRGTGVDPGPDGELLAAASTSALPAAPDLVDGAVAISGSPGLLTGVSDLGGAVGALLARLDHRGHVAVTAGLDRRQEPALAGVRTALARRTRRPVTLGPIGSGPDGSGPDGSGLGVHLQITAEFDADLDVPGRPFTFGRLAATQAAADAQQPADLGRPVLSLHLFDRRAGLAQLTAVLAGSEVAA
jgi:glucose-6-phosphate isomerase